MEQNQFTEKTEYNRSVKILSIPDMEPLIPQPVRVILDTLKAAGYEAYIVGGCVRDILLGRTPKDWDITTSALPGQVKELFAYTVDTGIQHGTVMILSQGEGYEVTTYRIDGEYRDSRHPEHVTFTPSLTEDLKRRDFTINAFAWDENGLVDLFDGLSDLKNGVIRCVGDPKQRFSEDALRIMRAVRFSAQLGFAIEQRTREQIAVFAEKLADISVERIRVEWEKTLLSPNPRYIHEYAELGLAPFIIQKYEELCFRSDSDALVQEIVRRRSEDEANAEMYRLLALAVFFRNLSAQQANEAFRNLKYDNRTRTSVVSILSHMDQSIRADRLQIKQDLCRMGQETFEAVLEYQKIRDYPDRSADLEQAQQIYRDILDSREAWSLKQLAVNGSDLIEAGVENGKKIGIFLEKILQKVIQSPTLNTKEKLCNQAFLSEVENECKGQL